MEENWRLMGEGLVCLLGIVAVVCAFLFGVRSGRVRERSEAARTRMQRNKMTIFRYQRQLDELHELVRQLEKDRDSQIMMSESYEQTQKELSHYHHKIEELERDIRRLSADANSSDGITGKPGSDFVQLLRSMRDDPLHANPSREEWAEIMIMTDLLFPGFLAGLKTRFGITRHEQEICCLIKWGFSRKEQLAVFNNTPDALTKSKGRLKKRLGLDEKTDLDNYIRSGLSG